MNRRLVTCALLLAAGTLARGQTLPVQHLHQPWGKCSGELVVHEDGIRYLSSKEKHSRNWSWSDVQGFDRHSRDRFRLTTYEDRLLGLGSDRVYDFRIVSEGASLEDPLFELVSRNLARPAVDRVEPSDPGGTRIPVKHLHAMGGCQGVLWISEGRVVFASESPRHNRTWDRDESYDVAYRTPSFFETLNYLYVGDGEFRHIDIPADARFLGVMNGQMLVQLKTDWQVGETTYPQAALMSIDFGRFMNGDRDFEVLVVVRLRGA